MGNSLKTPALSVLTGGLIRENPVLRLILGTCPTLAVTTSVENGLGMGLATLVVLIGSNFVVSLVRKIIPAKVRIPAYIVIIATFVTIVQFLLKAYLPDLDRALGIFIPLIVVNCIILGRAEMFAAKNGPWLSVLDAISMGLGFTLALVAIGSVREILGAGTWLGFDIYSTIFPPAVLMILPPGGFIAYGIIIAAVNKFSKTKVSKMGCATCDIECDPHLGTKATTEGTSS